MEPQNAEDIKKSFSEDRDWRWAWIDSAQFVRICQHSTIGAALSFPTPLSQLFHSQAINHWLGLPPGVASPMGKEQRRPSCTSSSSYPPLPRLFIWVGGCWKRWDVSAGGSQGRDVPAPCPNWPAAPGGGSGKCPTTVDWGSRLGWGLNTEFCQTGLHESWRSGMNRFVPISNRDSLREQDMATGSSSPPRILYWCGFYPQSSLSRCLRFWVYCNP